MSTPVDTQSILDLYFASPTAIVGSITAIVAFFSLRRTHKAEKVKHSIDFITSMNDRDTRTVIIRVQKFLIGSARLGTYQGFKRIVSVANADTSQESEQSRLKEAITIYLNEWERCANGIFYSSYDADFLQGVYAGTVVRSYFGLLPYILTRQGDHIRSGIKFSRLALEWHLKDSKDKKIPINPLLKQAHSHLVKHHKLVYQRGISMWFHNKTFNWFEDKDPDTELYKYHEYMTKFLLEDKQNSGFHKGYLELAGWRGNTPY